MFAFAFGFVALLFGACGASATSGGASSEGGAAAGAAAAGGCEPRAYTSGRAADIVLVADDSSSASVLRDRTREALLGVLQNAQPGDRVTAFWMNRAEPWMSATVPLPTAEEDPPIPTPPAEGASAPSVGGGRKSEEERLQRNAYFAALTKRCQAEQRYAARLAEWRTGQVEAVRKNDPPLAQRSPVFEAISRAALTLQSGNGGMRVLVISGDAEQYGGLTAVKSDSLTGVHVVLAPFRPADTEDWDSARRAIEGWLRPTRPASTEFISADLPPLALSEHVSKLRRGAG